jgi:TPR repeat protein
MDNDEEFYPTMERFKSLLELVIKGNDEDQCELGRYYYDYNSSKPVDVKQAMYWFEKSAKQNNRNAQYFLGRCYRYEAIDYDCNM